MSLKYSFHTQHHGLDLRTRWQKEMHYSFFSGFENKHYVFVSKFNLYSVINNISICSSILLSIQMNIDRPKLFHLPCKLGLVAKFKCFGVCNKQLAQKLYTETILWIFQPQGAISYQSGNYVTCVIKILYMSNMT